MIERLRQPRPQDGPIDRDREITDKLNEIIDAVNYLTDPVKVGSKARPMTFIALEDIRAGDLIVVDEETGMLKSRPA